MSDLGTSWEGTATRAAVVVLATGLAGAYLFLRSSGQWDWLQMLAWTIAPAAVGATIGVGCVRVWQLAADAVASHLWLAAPACILALVAAVVSGAFVANGLGPASEPETERELFAVFGSVLGAVHGGLGAVLGAALWLLAGRCLELTAL